MTENILAITTILVGSVAVWALLWLILVTLALVFRRIGHKLSLKLQNQGWSSASAEIVSMLPFSMAAGGTVSLLLLASKSSLATLYANFDHASLPNFDTMLLVTRIVIVVGMMAFFTLHVLVHTKDFPYSYKQ